MLKLNTPIKSGVIKLVLCNGLNKSKTIIVIFVNIRILPSRDMLLAEQINIPNYFMEIKSTEKDNEV